MPSLDYIFYGFLDTLTAHLVLVAFLLAVTDEKAVWQRLKKLPFLLPSPLLALLLTVGLQMVPVLGIPKYFIGSFAILIMCTIWVRWAWQWGVWKSLAATCMAGIFQVAVSTLSFWIPDEDTQFMAALGLFLGSGAAAALLHGAVKQLDAVEVGGIGNAVDFVQQLLYFLLKLCAVG